jgi:hypothetical protein
MLDQLGIEADKHGDSTAKLEIMIANQLSTGATPERKITASNCPS